jgi:hypothetical protein
MYPSLSFLLTNTVGQRQETNLYRFIYLYLIPTVGNARVQEFIENWVAVLFTEVDVILYF